MMNTQLRRDLLVLLFFSVLTLLMTWPLITKISTVYAGNNEDLWTFQWDNWWTRYALQHGHDILFTPMQFYPAGVSLAARSLSFYNSFLWIPLAALAGLLAGARAYVANDSGVSHLAAAVGAPTVALFLVCIDTPSVEH